MPALRAYRALLDRAIEEDVGTGDATSLAIFSADHRSAARIEARQPLVACGLPLAAEVFDAIDPGLSVGIETAEGEAVEPGRVLLRVDGATRSLLTAERTALNFLGRLCGIASFTRRFVDAVAGTRARIVDTRKTLPGWRVLDKYAVATGGGTNHRFGLYDAVLIKDNHVAAAGGVGAAVKAAREGSASHLSIQVEVESLEDARIAADAGADLLLLDNRTPPELQEIVEALGGRIPLEASGGIDLTNVAAVAATGVDRISIGALTHSAPAADVALEIELGAAPGR